MQVTLSTAINMDNYNLAVKEVKTILENILDVSRQWNITYDYGQCETHIAAENEQDALDWLIDELEKNGAELYVKPINEVEDLNEDMYVIGGNHGLALIHNGLLHIEEY